MQAPVGRCHLEILTRCSPADPCMPYLSGLPSSQSQGGGSLESPSLPPLPTFWDRVTVPSSPRVLGRYPERAGLTQRRQPGITPATILLACLVVSELKSQPSTRQR